jgi:hypothetical protein
MSQGIPFTPEQRQAIVNTAIEHMLNGESFAAVCKTAQVELPDGSTIPMPNRATLIRWMNDETEEGKALAASIARAREMQADALDDEIQSLIERMLKGELGYNEAKTAIWAAQWRASKMKPKKYGDRLDLGNADGTPFNITIAK